MKWLRRHDQDEPTSPPLRRQGLNPFQRRAVNSTLVHLEQQLLRLEQVVQGEEERVLLRRVGNISPEEQARLRDLFKHIRNQMRTIAAEYDLPGSEEDMRSALVGTATILWADLEELRPSTLDRYGAVDPALEATLGPRIEALIQSVLAVVELAKGERDAPTGS
jgi:hypothetical protein